MHGAEPNVSAQCNVFSSPLAGFHPFTPRRRKIFSCDFKFVLNSLRSLRRDTIGVEFISTHWYSTLQSLQIKSLCHATSRQLFTLCPSFASFHATDEIAFVTILAVTLSERNERFKFATLLPKPGTLIDASNLNYSCRSFFRNGLELEQGRRKRCERQFKNHQIFMNVDTIANFHDRRFWRGSCVRWDTKLFKVICRGLSGTLRWYW